MENKTKTRYVQCHKCGYTWKTKSKLRYVPCPNCRTTTKNEEEKTMNEIKADFENNKILNEFLNQKVKDSMSAKKNAAQNIVDSCEDVYK